MSILDRVLGPASKYDKSIPYTYEARYFYLEGTQDFSSFLSDTICGLVHYLMARGLNPGSVDIFEIYQNREVQIDPALYAENADTWITGTDLCLAFQKHYPGHIHSGSCSFDDRGIDGCGF
ncbi:MAG: hypothetical protein H6984_13115 [Pseudomonadales bacterium]|nr:hypothetical protein [Halioglobus sp.]MCP5123391.1 hypothetical protein [Pseudomonadales bacterium]MCP5193041.1 hypothetical protein [Pseudomonadales bacterium]